MSLAVLLLAVSVLAVGIGLMILGQASDARGKAQKAADAAALAAAEEIKQDWLQAWIEDQDVPVPSDAPGAASDLPQFNNSGFGPAGLSAARQFADANSGSAVTDYDWSGFGVGSSSGVVTVVTESAEGEAVGTADRIVGVPQGSASATAEVWVGEDVGCSYRDVEPADDDDDDGDDDGQDESNGDDSAEPPESWSVQCNGPFGSVTVRYHGDNLSGAIYDASELSQLLEVRLTE